VVLDLESFAGVEADLFGVDLVGTRLRRVDARACRDRAAAGIGLRDAGEMEQGSSAKRINSVFSGQDGSK
jgi:hypothetical protein